MKLQDIFEETPGEEPSQYGLSNTAEVRVSAWPYLQQEIEKLNKKAERFGAPAITLTQEHKFLKQNAEGKSEMWIKVKIEGKAPMVAGYKFVATIQHKESGNIIRTAPGYVHNEQIKDFYDANPDYCDQCKKKRRRIDTFIVQDEQGNLRQIGRNCLSLFLGGRDPKAILWYFSLQDMAGKIIDDAGKIVHKQVGKVEEFYVTFDDQFLPACAAAVRVYNYRKTRDQNGDVVSNSTAAMCRDFFFYGHHNAAWEQVMGNPTPADHQMAKDILAWWQTIPKPEIDKSEFLHNLDVIVRGNHICSRDFGYAAAIFPAYHRANPSTQQTTGPAKKNEHVGTVGSKIPPTPMKIIRQHEVNSDYGRSYMTVAEDNDGRLFMWYDKQQLDTAQQYTISGTVKGQNDFKGRKQTVLNRVKH